MSFVHQLTDSKIVIVDRQLMGPSALNDKGRISSRITLAALPNEIGGGVLHHIGRSHSTANRT